MLTGHSAKADLCNPARRERYTGSDVPSFRHSRAAMNELAFPCFSRLLKQDNGVWIPVRAASRRAEARFIASRIG